jgi:hypothetical protein
LQQLFLEAFNALLHNRSTNTLQSADPLVQKVATAQELTVWHHILKGRFTKELRITQDKYLRENHIHTKKKNGASWMTTVIDTIFKEWNTLWDLRNGDRHGRDTKTKMQAADERQAIRECTQLYEKHKDTVTADLQYLFAIPLQERFQQKYSALRQWIDGWKPIIEKSYTTALETG